MNNLEKLVEDIRQRHPGAQILQDGHMAVQYVLQEIKEFLSKVARNKPVTNSEFGIPEPESGLGPLRPEEDITAELRRKVVNCISKMNDGQKVVFNRVVGEVMPGVSLDNICPETAEIMTGTTFLPNTDEDRRKSNSF